jgi:hypothetical protein
MNPSMEARADNNTRDNDSIDIYNCDEDDEERLIKPRNNFASYSNEDINVRFRVCLIFLCFKMVPASVISRSISRAFYCITQNTADVNLACSDIEAISGQSKRLYIRDITPGATNFISTNYEVID